MIVRLPALGYSMGDLDPGAILAPGRDELARETLQLRDRIDQLGRDWFNSDGNTVSQNLLSRWDAFVDEIKTWDSGPDFLTHVWNTTWRDELLDYQKKFNGFVAEFQQAGVGTGAPVFTFNPGPPSTIDKILNKAGDAAAAATKPISDAITTLEIVAGAIGVAAVGYIFYLTYETGRTARSIGPKAFGR